MSNLFYGKHGPGANESYERKARESSSKLMLTNKRVPCFRIGIAPIGMKDAYWLHIEVRTHTKPDHWYHKVQEGWAASFDDRELAIFAAMVAFERLAEDPFTAPLLSE